KVPVEVAATGPRVIEVAARHADRICFAVGADPTYLGVALERARAAARAAGRDPAALRYGAVVTCVLHDDAAGGAAAARRRAAACGAPRGAVATFAGFAALPGSPLEALPPRLRQTAEYLRAHYDMREHTRAGVGHTAGIDDEFVDWFAIAGPVERALPRLRALAALGLDFVHVIPGSSNVPREIVTGSLAAVGRDRLPALRTSA